MKAWKTILAELKTLSLPLGFDLISPLSTQFYNQAIDGTGLTPLDEFGRSQSLSFVFGNTRVLWPIFIDALRKEAEPFYSANPLDTYVEGSIHGIAATLECAHTIRFSHSLDHRKVAMQRAADLAQMASLSECYLSIHPRFGPWIGLRAILSLDCEYEGPTALLTKACECETGCKQAFEAVVASKASIQDPEKRWKEWLNVRDACPVGQAYRYSDAQIRYHYTKDQEILKACLR